MHVTLFSHLLTDNSPVSVLREIGSEAQRQRHFLGLIYFIFLCDKACTVAKNITGFFFVFFIESQMSSPGEKKYRKSNTMHYFS